MNGKEQFVTMQSQKPRRGWPGEWEWASLIATLLLCCWHFLLLPLGLDQGIYAVNALRLLDGWALYAGAWDMKGPGIFFLYLPFVAQGRGAVWPVFAGSIFCALLVLLAIYRLAAAALSKAAAWGAVIFYLVIISSWGNPIKLGQPDEWLAPLLLWALILMDDAWHCAAGANRRALSAGLLLGAAILLRPPFLLSAVLLALIWLPLPGSLRGIFRRGGAIGQNAGCAGDVIGGAAGFGNQDSPLQTESCITWWRALRLALLYAAGGIGSGALYLFYCLATGSLDEFLYTQLDWNVKYAQTEFRWEHLDLYFVFDIFKNRWDEHFKLCAELSVALPAGLGGLLFFPLLRLRLPWRFIWLWLLGFLATLLSLFIQLKFFNYHFWPLLPFMALAIATGLHPLILIWQQLWRVGRRLPNGPLNKIALHALLLILPLAGLAAIYLRNDTALHVFRKRQKQALAFLRGEEDRKKFYDRFKFHHIYDPFEDWLLVEKIRELHTGGAPPKVYIWAFRPEIYYMLNQTGPSPFPYNLPLRAVWSPPEWLEREQALVLREPPDFVIIGEFDQTQWVTRSTHTSKQDIPPWLQEYLDEYCEYVARHKHSHLWRRTR